MEETTISVPSSIWTSLNGWFTSTVFFILLNLMIATIVFTSNLPTNNNNNQPQNNQQQQGEQEDQQQQKQKQDSNNNPQNQPQVARSPSILNRIKSFNFYPQISQPGSDPETHYQENPLEVAATQFVFNQPLHYQHFDFDPVNQGEEMETGRTHFEFDPTNQETGTTHFDYDPINSGQETERGLTHFDFDSTHEETTMTHFDFDPARQDSSFEEETDDFESLDDVYSKLKSGGGHVDRSKSDGEIPARVSAKPAVAKMRKSASMKVGFSNIESEEKVEARRPATSRKAAAPAMDEDDVDEDDVEVDAKADDFINKFKNDLKLQRIESIMKNGGKK